MALLHASRDLPLLKAPEGTIPAFTTPPNPGNAGCMGERRCPRSPRFSKSGRRACSLLRFVTGLSFLHVGMAKLFSFPSVPMFANMHMSSLLGGFAPLWVQGVIELLGGAL